MNSAPFLILETGQPVASLRRYGRFPHWIRVAAGLDADETVVVDVEHGGALPDHRHFAGVIVTGSAAYVTDRADWSERSAQWLRGAVHDDRPVFGICYGHQLLAHALGGEVAYNPAGRESGTIELALDPSASSDPLFAGLPERFPAHATHMQTVLRAPEGASIWRARRRTTATPSVSAARPGACSSTRSSPPTTCAATYAPAPSASAATAAAPAAWRAGSARPHWRGSCCAVSCARPATPEPPAGHCDAASRRCGPAFRWRVRKTGIIERIRGCCAPSPCFRNGMSEIRKLPASAGAQWLLDAFSLYARAPMQLAVIGVVWMLTTSLILLLAQLLPGWLGLMVQLLSLAVGPLMFGGMLWAVSEIDQGRPGLPTHLLQPIRDRRVTHLLVPLAIQLIAIVALGTLLFALIGSEGFSAFNDLLHRAQELQQSGKQLSNEETLALMANVPVKRIMLWILIAFATFVALSMAMFAQPALVVFDRQSGMHALRMSLQGCIENFPAMAVFMVLGLIAAMCIYFLVFVLMQVALLLGGMGAAAFVMQLSMTTVIMPLYVGAVYAAWKQMFAHRGRTPPPVPGGPGNVFAA